MAGYKFCPLCGSTLTDTHVDGKSRLKCSSENCSYVFWDNPLPVVAAVIEYDGKALLARNTLWPEKVFALITGFLEKDETPEEAVKREVKEETGLDTVEMNYIGLYAFMEKNQIIMAYYLKCTGSIVLNDEIAETKIIPFEKLRPWPMGTGPAVRDVLIRKGIISQSDIKSGRRDSDA
jgi:NADH pyrophosphatase NudC (nudix superfamily)